MKICTSIFEEQKASLMSNAGVLDALNTFINITKKGLDKGAFGLLNQFIKDSKESGIYSVKEGAVIFQGMCKCLVPIDNNNGAYNIKPCRMDINLKKDNDLFGFYVILTEDSALPSERNRVIHFSFDFSKESASLFCISESSMKINGELERLCKMFAEPYELMEGDNIETCINFFAFNILYKYLLPTTLESVYVSDLFNV